MEKVSVRRTIKGRSFRKALRMYLRYVGSLKEINLYKSPLIQTVSVSFFSIERDHAGVLIKIISGVN